MNPVVIAITSAIQSNPKTRQDFTLSFVRHVVLSSIKNTRNQFVAAPQLETVLCCDAKTNWRKEVYPHYKANRKKIRQSMVFPWTEFSEYYEIVKQELIQVLPYKILQIERCEADDIIAVLTHTLTSEGKKCIIFSADSDFAQLHNSSVIQYSQMKRGWVNWPNPQAELLRKIISGDTGDGVPNVLSDDDTFVNPDKRQKQMRAENLKMLVEAVGEGKEDTLPIEIQTNIARNRKLIQLNKDSIPEDIWSEIVAKYTEYQVPRADLYKYLSEHNLKLIMKDTRGLI